jgi:hypothetical protein
MYEAVLIALVVLFVALLACAGAHYLSYGNFWREQRWKFWGAIVMVPLMGDLFAGFLHTANANSLWAIAFLCAFAGTFVADVVVWAKFAIDHGA